MSKANIYQDSSTEARLANAIEMINEGRIQSAVEALKRLVDEGVDSANLYLASIYEIGYPSVPVNYEFASFYYMQAVKFGWPRAYIGLGRIALMGKGCAPDPKAAYQYFKELDTEDLQSPLALYFLGKMYATGVYVERDFQQALKYLKRSANLGYFYAYRTIAGLYLSRGNIFGWLWAHVVGRRRVFGHLASGEFLGWRMSNPYQSLGAIIDPSKHSEDN